MKQWMAILLVFSLLALTGCTTRDTAHSTDPVQTVQLAPETVQTQPPLTGEITEIRFEEDCVLVDGAAAGEDPAAVYLSRDIIYYEDRDAYESGNPYGEGGSADKHTAREAAEHLVVNITQPGNYRLSGVLRLGQVRIDLGEDAPEDPNAVVNLILDGVEINCTVAPAILFRNVYECDGDRNEETATPEVNTAAAGANLILAENSENRVEGSYVAKIYKDKDGEKKLCKQDGAIYSYMSMNVGGTGSLQLQAENEGLDTELHLTINGGDICIFSQNDGINTNEDGVSVTTINGGNIRILAGLGDEGDGIDSNGYLVINGGTVVSAANPASDAGLDSDLGSFIHGGTVVALGSTMDWPESDSEQVTMNLQFASMQESDSAIVVTDMEGKAVFAFDPGEDPALSQVSRRYMGAVISCGNFQVGESYLLYGGGTVTGSHSGGIYDVSTVTGYTDGVQQAYTGTDVMRGPGMMGDFGDGQRPEGQFDDRKPGQRPEDGEIPTMPEGETMPTWPEGEQPDWPDEEMPTMPKGEPPELPEGETFPQDWKQENFGPMDRQDPPGEKNAVFYMQDKVNFFSGVAETE